MKDGGRTIWGIQPDDQSDELEQLVHRVYREIARRPPAPADLKEAMIALLSYLASPEGRTDRNCRRVDAFFCVRDDWETDWDHLPEELRIILEDIGGILHDTLSAPEIAENFESTPEQLLARVRRCLRTDE